MFKALTEEAGVGLEKPVCGFQATVLLDHSEENSGAVTGLANDPAVEARAWRRRNAAPEKRRLPSLRSGLLASLPKPGPRSFGRLLQVSGKLRYRAGIASHGRNPDGRCRPSGGRRRLGLQPVVALANNGIAGAVAALDAADLAKVDLGVQAA